MTPTNNNKTTKIDKLDSIEVRNMCIRAHFDKNKNINYRMRYDICNKDKKNAQYH